MKKYFSFGLLVFAFHFLLAQENENIFEVEYELNGAQVKSLAFSVENCSQTIIHNTWQNWVMNKGGSFNILKKYEANNLQFKNSDDRYKVTLSIVEDSPTKKTIINTLTDQNGMYFSESNPDFNEIYEKLLDLSFQTRKACVRNSLRVANEAMIRLSKQNVDLQSRKGSAIKSYLKSNNELLKLENKKMLLADKLDLLQNQLERSSDDKKIAELMKRKSKAENSFATLESKIESLTAKVSMAEQESELLDKEIDVTTSQLQTQREMINTFKNKFNSIQR